MLTSFLAGLMIGAALVAGVAAFHLLYRAITGE